MAIYLLVFFFSSLFTYIAQRINKKGIFYVFSFLAILLPALLAGFRSPGIGTDTLVYVDYIWDKIQFVPKWHDFTFYYTNGYFGDIELVYLLLNWLTSHVTSDVNGIYFVTNIVTMLFVYCSAYDNRNRCDMWLSVAFFLLLYYNASLNMVRQSLALSMCMYAYKYIEREQWLKVGLWGWVIILTHNTGIFFLLIFFIQQIFKIKKKILASCLKIGVVIVIPLSLIALDFVLVFFVNWGLLPAKFLMYLSSESNSNITKSVFIIYLSILLMMLYIKRRIRNDKKKSAEVGMYTYSQFIGTILFLASIISLWAYRISYYINYISICIYLPRTLYLLKKKKQRVAYNIFTIITLLLFLILWYWTIVVNAGHETVPYKSKFLGI